VYIQLLNVFACVFLVASRLSIVCLSVCIQHKSKSSERIWTKFSEKVSYDKIRNSTMQFANRLLFSQYLVPRYSESPAVAPAPIEIWGLRTAKHFIVPQPLHQVSATGMRVSSASTEGRSLATFNVTDRWPDHADLTIAGGRIGRDWHLIRPRSLGELRRYTPQ